MAKWFGFTDQYARTVFGGILSLANFIYTTLESYFLVNKTYVSGDDLPEKNNLSFGTRFRVGSG